MQVILFMQQMPRKQVILLCQAIQKQVKILADN